MKALHYLYVICLISLFSCGKSSESSTESPNEKTETSKESSSAKNNSSKKGNGKIGPIKRTTESQNGVDITYEVKEMELHSDAAVINYDDMDKVTANSDDFTSYTFSKKAKSVSSLKQGQVVVLAGETIGRIASITDDKGKTTITLSPATLNEAFKNLDVEYEAKVNWKKLKKTAYFPSEPKMVYAGFAGGGNTIFSETMKFSHGGYDMTMKLTPKTGSQLDYKLTIKKVGKSTMGSVMVGVEANGSIDQYINKSKLKIYNSSLNSFEYQEDMKADMTFKFTGVGPGSEIMKIAPTATLVKIPLRIGIIPISVELKIKLELRPILSSGGSSKADYKVTYDTAGQGFKFVAGGDINPVSGSKSVNMSVNGETVSAGTVTTGFGAGINFPVIEVGLFGNTVIPEFYFNFDCSTLYEPGIKTGMRPCQSGKSTAQAVAGVKLKFFGLEKETLGYIWKEEKTHGGECDSYD